MGEIEGQEPHLNSGIEEGDTIIKINGHLVETAEELIETVNIYEGNPVEIKHTRDGEELLATIQPVRHSNR